ncbi:hypothetical protein OROGR_031477 [Orobanche gracilis]
MENKKKDAGKRKRIPNKHLPYEGPRPVFGAQLRRKHLVRFGAPNNALRDDTYNEPEEIEGEALWYVEDNVGDVVHNHGVEEEHIGVEEEHRGVDQDIDDLQQGIFQIGYTNSEQGMNKKDAQEQPIDGPKINEEQPIHGPEINEEEPIHGLEINEEEPIHGPEINEEQPIDESDESDEEFRETDSEEDFLDDIMYEENIDKDVEWVGLNSDKDDGSSSDDADEELSNESDFDSVASFEDVDEDERQTELTFRQSQVENPIFLVEQIFASKQLFKDAVNMLSVIKQSSEAMWNYISLSEFHWRSTSCWCFKLHFTSTLSWNELQPKHLHWLQCEYWRYEYKQRWYESDLTRR